MSTALFVARRGRNKMTSITDKLAKVLNDLLPRYEELFVNAGLGDSIKDSVCYDDIQQALAEYPTENNRIGDWDAFEVDVENMAEDIHEQRATVDDRVDIEKCSIEDQLIYWKRMAKAMHDWAQELKLTAPTPEPTNTADIAEDKLNLFESCRTSTPLGDTEYLYYRFKRHDHEVLAKTLLTPEPIEWALEIPKKLTVSEDGGYSVYDTDKGKWIAGKHDLTKNPMPQDILDVLLTPEAEVVSVEELSASIFGIIAEHSGKVTVDNAVLCGLIMSRLALHKDGIKVVE